MLSAINRDAFSICMLPNVQWYERDKNVRHRLQPQGEDGQSCVASFTVFEVDW